MSAYLAKLIYMKRSICYLLFFIGSLSFVFSQEKLPEDHISQAEIEAHLRFLAADELKGRKTGEMGNNIAAAYIAAQLRSFGVKEVEGAENYYQKIPFETYTANGSFTWEEQSLKHGGDMVIMAGEGQTIEAQAVFVDYGWVDEGKGYDDYKKIDVKGKIVIANLGLPKDDNPISIVQAAKIKRKLAMERGAVALLELYRLNMPWRFVSQQFSASRLLIMNQPSDRLPYGWINDPKGELVQRLQKSKKLKVSLQMEEAKYSPKPSQNVVGWIPGTDPELSKEYMIISAHYDHVGVGGTRATKEDSIFNGARDNAIGTVALISAAKSLAMKPPKRSILILAVTGEEMGLLGSNYYANNPLLPLKDMKFDLNCDGAGYNDTSMLSVVGFDHLEVEGIISEAASRNGLKTGGDVVPEQGLYDRSDNASFARKGIPAINVSPGVKAFDAELMKYYHQVADEAESLNFGYVTRFMRAFAHIGRLIADLDKMPIWKADSKYRAQGEELYQER